MNNSIKKVVTTLSLTVILFSTIFYANDTNALTETEAANKLSSLWVIVDQSSNPESYNLEMSITRREMLKVMINLSLMEVWDTCTGKFADLPESDWWCKYAESALARGFIAPNTLFRPNDNVSKVEALKMILQARDISKNNSLADWRAWYVYVALVNGILSSSFTDYDTAWVRGWIFLIWANAIDATPNYKVGCVDEVEGTPIITSISTNSWTVGTKIVIRGCNFSGFEWDKNVWIENNQGVKWIIYWETWSTSNLLNITLNAQLCQTDTTYSGLACDSWITLVPWDYKIYVNPWWKQSNIINFTVNNSASEMSYQDVMDYVTQNITEIVTPYSSIVPANGKWFANWFGFTSTNYVYVNYEDGHNIYRALLNCNMTNNMISCDPLAVFEKPNDLRILVQWEDTQKDNSIVYKYAVDYEWER